MMDQTHIGYTYWQEPPRNVMPRVDVIQVPAPAEMGVAFEGQVPFGVPGQGAAAGRSGAAARAGAAGVRRLSTGSRHYIDVYNRGQTPFAFTGNGGGAVGRRSRRRAGRSRSSSG